MMKKYLDLSVIIPAYNSQKNIRLVIERIVKVLSDRNIRFEVLCISDGCTDATLKVAENEAQKHRGKVKVFGYQKNRGKGYAVRFGMKKAKGEIVGFIDADNEISPGSILSLLKVMKEQNADIVVGSKRNKKSKVTYPLLRRFISSIYYYFVKLIFKVKVSDTQAGIKLFRRNVIEGILPKLKVDGFAFDIEMLVRAEDAGFTKIFDSPILVDSGYSSGSSVFKSFGILRESLKMFIDTTGLFLKLKVLK